MKVQTQGLDVWKAPHQLDPTAVRPCALNPNTLNSFRLRIPKGPLNPKNQLRNPLEIPSRAAKPETLNPKPWRPHALNLEPKAVGLRTVGSSCPNTEQAFWFRVQGFPWKEPVKGSSQHAEVFLECFVRGLVFYRDLNSQTEALKENPKTWNLARSLGFMLSVFLWTLFRLRVQQEFL